METSSKRLWNRVVRVRRQKQILREIHFHAVALPNRDGRGYLHEAIKDRGRRLRNTASRPVGECLGTAGGNRAAALRDFARSGDHAQSYGGAENLKVMIVDLVLQPFLADLVEA